FLMGSLDALFRFLRDMPRRADVEAESRALGRALGRWILDLAFLPFEAWNATDAAVRALHRMAVSRRGLLQWTTAAATARLLGRARSPWLMLRHLWMGPAIGVAAGTGALLLHGAVGGGASAILLLWVASPVLATAVSRP